MTSSTRRKTRGPRTRFFFRWTKWSGRKLFKWRGIPRQRSLKYYMEDTQFMQARETFIYVPARSRLNGHQGFKGLELWFVSRLKSDINPVTKPFLVRRGKRWLSRPIASFFDSICFPKLQSHYHINCSSVQGLRQWSRSKSSPPKALCFLESSCQRSQRSCNSCKAFWTCSWESSHRLVELKKTSTIRRLQGVQSMAVLPKSLVVRLSCAAYAVAQRFNGKDSDLDITQLRLQKVISRTCSRRFSWGATGRMILSMVLAWLQHWNIKRKLWGLTKLNSIWFLIKKDSQRLQGLHHDNSIGW